MTRDNRPSPQSDQICHSGDKMNMGQKNRGKYWGKIGKIWPKIGARIRAPSRTCTVCM